MLTIKWRFVHDCCLEDAVYHSKVFKAIFAKYTRKEI